MRMLAASLCLFLIVGCSCGVIDREFGPTALLKKYEDFKDIAAALEAKQASIAVAEVRLKSFDSFGPRAGWHRDDVQTFNQIAAEISGMKASYNQLAADYNARMSKDNYSFCEVGTLPPGATKPLPRSFKPYLEK